MDRTVEVEGLTAEIPDSPLFEFHTRWALMNGDTSLPPWNPIFAAVAATEWKHRFWEDDPCAENAAAQHKAWIEIYELLLCKWKIG